MTELRHSYSTLNLLTRCPKAYAYRYKERLLPIRRNLNMFRGTVFHLLIEADLLSRGQHLLQKPKSLTAFSQEHVIDWEISPTIMHPEGQEMPLEAPSVMELLHYWQCGLDQAQLDRHEQKWGESLYDRMLHLWSAYQAYYVGDKDRYIPLLTEVEWKRETPSGMVLQGRCDAVLWDNQYNMTVIQDTKTHDSWPSGSQSVQELFDSQLHLNAWGLAPVLRDLAKGTEWEDTDLIPRGLMYNRVRTKKPTMPELTKGGSLSKRITDYDLMTYEKFCTAHPDYEVDEAILERLKSDKDAWFRRRTQPVNMHVIREHILSLQARAQVAEDLTTDSAVRYPTKDCERCEFLQLCRADLLGGPKERDEEELAEVGLRREND